MNERPNVILINCDDMGYGDLGCYGSQVNKTPILDRMAAEGIRFTNFYMGAAVCTPSRGAMLTGCYPPRIGFGEFGPYSVLFPGQGIGLNPEETTLAGLLKGVGYRTKIIGKWHCGDQKPFLPLAHGFDEYYGLPFSNDMGRQTGLANDMPPLPLIEGDEVLQFQPEQRGLTERYAEQAVSFIRRNRKERFFLYLAHMHTHVPLYASDIFVRQSENGDYGACVAEVDWTLAVLRHELDRLGLLENTIIIFTSDNGSRGINGGSNLPLRGAKAQSYEGGFRVPCIISWPRAVRRGIVYDGMMSSMDFFSTLGSLCEAPPSNDKMIDSLDFSGLFLGDEEFKSPRETFFYYRGNGLEAVRSGRWKLHVNNNGTIVNELYDLDTDLGEACNLYDEKPDVVAELKKLLSACADDLGDKYAGKAGCNNREPGRIENPVFLSSYSEDHPYICAVYDKTDRG